MCKVSAARRYYMRLLSEIVYRRSGGDRRPPPGSPQPGILLVKNYPEKTSEDELRQLFERFGKLKEGP